MKKTALLFFILVIMAIPTFSAEKSNLTEITCDMVRRVSFGAYSSESYETMSFFIDDNEKQLFYAPSMNPCLSASKLFNSNQISLYGMPFGDDFGGDLHINRNTGTIKMLFQDRSQATVVFTGRGTKVENTQKF